MSTKETVKINDTQGKEEEVPCSKCNGKTFHKVLLSIDKSGGEHDGDYSFLWDTHY